MLERYGRDSERPSARMNTSNAQSIVKSVTCAVIRPTPIPGLFARMQAGSIICVGSGRRLATEQLTAYQDHALKPYDWEC